MPADRLAETFVELADTLVADFDLIDFMHLLADRCVSLLYVSAAGLLLADQHGQLRVLGASSEQARILELFELQRNEGPCLECYRTGQLVTLEDVRSGEQRWPEFAQATSAAGFGAVHAMPMRLRSNVIGALSLFRTKSAPLDQVSIRVAQALADVATISLLQERALRRQETLAEQLQAALNSRVLIEQAKGVLAERLQVNMERAFAALRHFARHHNQQISDVAETVIRNTIDMDELNRLRGLAEASE